MANPTPAITFRVNLKPFSNEAFGPAAGVTGVLSPDRHVSDQDSAIEALETRAGQRLAHLPSLSVGNHKLVHGEEFTAYGQKAVYLRQMYAVGYAPAERAYLEIVS
jgi:hypothetical protein